MSSRCDAAIMHGLHLTADLYGCTGAAAYLGCEKSIAALCCTQIRACGLTIVGERWVTFPSRPEYQNQLGGITGAVLLAESHLAIHTWPEIGHVTLDIYVCNFSEDNSAKARALMDALVSAYAPVHKICHELLRGNLR